MIARLVSIIALLTAVGQCRPTVIDLTLIDWTLTETTHNISVPGRVPSQTHLDLLKAGVIGEPTYGLNEREQAWVAKANFSYTSDVIQNLDPNRSTYLIFDGLDTFADIAFCGEHVASAGNQFRQWTFDITDVLQQCTHPTSIDVDFTSALSSAAAANNTYHCKECIASQYEYSGRLFIRKEQMDLGWDWAPGLVPQGIWKAARIVQLDSANDLFVQNFYVDVHKRGQVNNLSPDQSQPWILNMTFETLGARPSNLHLSVTVKNSDGSLFWQEDFDTSLATGGTFSASVTIDKVPDLWYPIGYGAQPSYNLSVSLLSTPGNLSFGSVEKRIGFRTIVLNQTPITASQIAADVAPGANWHFDVNGQPVYIKGSNFVPPDPFWPRVTEDDFRRLLSSAASMNQNMLRIWAGPIYMPDMMYDIADELGIMLWSEMQFSDALYPLAPSFLSDITAEVSAQVLRLNSHPSQALWCGNNELGLLLEILEFIGAQYLYPAAAENFEQMFGETLVNAVLANSRSISYLATSTSYGYKSYDHSAARPFDFRTLADTFNQSLAPGSIFDDSDMYNYNVSQAFTQSTFPNARFADEFGFHSHASYLTYADSLPSDQLTFNSTMIVGRNRN